jgi:ribosome-associated toxin RatA of RatAB toxin-antitoxin module
MQTENRTIMQGDLETIVSLAADVERWPVILPHYRWVRLIEGGGNEKLVEMAARRGRIPVKWQAMQTVDRSDRTPVIRYLHVRGVTRGMEVAWTFDPTPTGVGVRIDHEFIPPWPVVGGTVADRVIGPHFVAAIAGQTLSTIKRIVENRDGRFLPDGQLR